VSTGLGLFWLFLLVVCKTTVAELLECKTTVAELLEDRRFVREINRQLRERQFRDGREPREQEPGRDE
jgi:uncharacterized membrane protein YccC